MSASDRYTVFGIRHHGPGSARSLRRALEAYRPDAVLVEGPPDAEAALPWLLHAGMQPPVALLVYTPDHPRNAAYYPFAVFSPEWQALHYGLSHGLAVRFMDLPQTHQLAANQEPKPASQTGSAAEWEPEAPPAPIPMDPIAWLAEMAGYSDSERWWEHLVEQRRDSADLFAAILELMTTLRAEVEAQLSADGAQAAELHSPIEARREAYMRQTLRAALKEGYQRIAVVCGAWHAPALMDMPPAQSDARLLKGLPKVKVAATWVPWTYGRLCQENGYGAGIESPGWYHHLWQADADDSPEAVTVRWMTEVARLLRAEDLEASSAHAIEAVRLAESLAAIRGRPLPGLPELNDATLAVLCAGDPLPLKLVRRRLIVSERMGSTPSEAPTVPLQADLMAAQKRLRLPPDPDERELDLDLRKPTDLERSHLLHRLTILGVEWGLPVEARRKSGTFHELWRLQWLPEFAVALIDASRWGNTVPDAASALAVVDATNTFDLPALTALVGRAILADLPDAVAQMMSRLEGAAALASDVAQLMDALAPLAEALRYGDVRSSDEGMLRRVVDGLVERICIGLPAACASLDETAAQEMFTRLVATQAGLFLIGSEAQLASWQRALESLAAAESVHGLVSGRSCRLLLDMSAIPVEAAARQLRLRLSLAAEPQQAAAWVEGFLRNSGSLLLHDPTLFGVLESWIAALPEEAFQLALPLVRRTFSSFSIAERRALGEKVRGGNAPLAAAASPEFDPQRAGAVLPLLRQILGG